MKKELQGQQTDEQIKMLKAKHGDILTAKAEGHIAYFRKPNRPEVSFAMTLQSDPLKMGEALMRNCLIAGSDVFITDIEFMLGAAKLVEQLIKVKVVELGKL